MLVIWRGQMYVMFWTITGFFAIGLFPFSFSWKLTRHKLQCWKSSLLSCHVLCSRHIIFESSGSVSTELGQFYFFFNRTQLSSISQMLLYLLFLPLSYICTLYYITKNCIMGILTLSMVNFLNHFDFFKLSSYHISPNEEEKLL